MRFELSCRIRTDVSEEELLSALLRQFKKISGQAKRYNHQVIARAIDRTIGAPFRNTRVAVTARAADGGYLVVADVSYTPSIGFFIAFVGGLFTLFLWLVPVVLYLTQKGSVRTTIERALSRVKDEYESVSAPAAPTRPGLVAELEALNRLKMEGVLTEDEFAAQKRRLLVTSTG